MPIELTHGHLRYMNLGKNYWAAKEKNLTKSQLSSLKSYLGKIPESIQRGIGVFLWGDNNVGKSYVCAVLCKLVWSKYRVATYCVTASEMRDAFIDNDIPANIDSDELMLDRMKKVRYLFIDDLGKEYKSDSGYFESRYGSLLRYRVRNKLVTNVTSNLLPNDFKDIFGRSTSQLMKECMYPIKMNGDDMREKKASTIISMMEE